MINSRNFREGAAAMRRLAGTHLVSPRAVAKRGRRDAGFTLIEMVIAVAVLAVLVGIVPRSFVFARSIIDHSRDWMGARLVAEAVLNDELAGPKLQPGGRGGLIDGRRWKATLRRHTAMGTPVLETGRMLLDVRIEVEVAAGRTLEIETMRIGGSQ
jgi:prepilin-type N-terminal cleavage/methylation domain-containing protein